MRRCLAAGSIATIAIGSSVLISRLHTLPTAVSRTLEDAGIGAAKIIGNHPSSQGGGNLLLQSDAGELFVKFRERAPRGLFAAEAAGLKQLADTCTIPVVRALAVSEQCICLQHLPRSQPSAESWARAGENLAALHRQRAAQFGFDQDNFCGDSRQPNPPTADGHQFFGEQRLMYQGGIAYRRGLLGRDQLQRLEQLCERLPRLIPPQPAVLIHGDLWHGNLHPSGNEIVLIDPACHYGWAEAELAMTTLFGSLPPTFYAAYESAGSVEPDWRARAGLYNLYHLLNHLNLFGAGYLADVTTTINHYLAD